MTTTTSRPRPSTSSADPDWTAVSLAYADDTQTIASICDRFDITAAQLRRARTAQGWTARPSAVAARLSAGDGRSNGALQKPLKDLATKPVRQTPAGLIETLSELTARPIFTAADPVPGTVNPDSRTSDRTSDRTNATRANTSQANTAPADTAQANPPRQPTASQAATATSKRKTTIAKFYDAIHRDMGRIDKLMDATNLKAGDAERLVRALASIIQSYERVLELDPTIRSARHRSDAKSTEPKSSDPRSHRAGASAGTNAATGIDPSGAADAERLRRQIAERLERLMENGLAARTPSEPAP